MTRLISADEVLSRIQEDIDRYKGSTDLIELAIAAGLETARTNVILAETKGWEK